MKYDKWVNASIGYISGFLEQLEDDEREDFITMLIDAIKECK